MKLWINFIPIFIIFLLVTYTPEFVKFSHSILGKFLSVVLIIFYVKVDLLAGLLVCLLVIFYYQTDYIESFESSPENSNVLNQDPTKSLTTEKINEQEEPEEEPEEEPDKTNLENFETITDAYPLSVTKPLIYDKSKETFRKTHCKKGHLIHKGTMIKNEMAEHIFQEIKQNDFHKCNVCDPSCDFDVIEKYIKTEEDLMKPKSSNEMFETVWQNMRKTTESLLSK